MPGRFQFSLRALMGAMTLFAISLWFLAQRNGLVLAFPLVLGAAIGQLFGRPLEGAGIVLGLLWLAFFILTMLAGIGSMF